MRYSEGLIEDLGAGFPSSVAHVPNVVSTLKIARCVAVANVACVGQGEVLKEISRLQNDVNGIKLAQDKQVKGLKNHVQNNLKVEIARLLE